MRISDWSSDVCSSDLLHDPAGWAALASDFLDFARTRKRGTANVRLFNPDMKQHGWESPHTVLQIVNDDMPFLVDSVTMALAEQGIGVYVLGHPVVPITRDRAGKLLEVGEGNPESLMHMEDDRLTGDAIDTVRTTLQGVLAEVRGIVADWGAMREKMMQAAGVPASSRQQLHQESARGAKR